MCSAVMHRADISPAGRRRELKERNRTCPSAPPQTSPRRGPNRSAQGRAQRRPGESGSPRNKALKGRNKTRSERVRCFALSGLGVVILLPQGGAARLAPLRCALGWCVAAPSGRKPSDQSALTSMRLGLTSSRLSSVTSSTPSLRLARTFASSTTEGSSNLRLNLP